MLDMKVHELLKVLGDAKNALFDALKFNSIESVYLDTCEATLLTMSGWEFTIFMDSNEFCSDDWDYVETFTTPEGKKFDPWKIKETAEAIIYFNETDFKGYLKYIWPKQTEAT